MIKAILKLISKVGIADVSMTDLLHPSKDRLRVILSALIK
jgi:hypothetical protein